MPKIQNLKHVSDLEFGISNLPALSLSNGFRISSLDPARDRDFGFEISPPTAGCVRGGRGFTLLETIVALALIVGAMAGPFTLATRGIFAAKFSKSQLVALNLAQEGIEIIRHARENNLVLANNVDNGVTWRGMPPGPCPATCTALPNGGYQPDVFTTPTLTTAQNALSREPITGLYYQDPLLANRTPFTRVVLISTPATDQMRVVATITWTESSIPRQVKLEEVLYNWQ